MDLLDGAPMRKGSGRRCAVYTSDSNAVEIAARGVAAINN